jgi:hypothetical protein
VYRPASTMTRATLALLSGLKGEQQRPMPFIACRGQFRRRAEQAGDVHVVTAGVHYRNVRAARVRAAYAARVHQAGLLKHQEPVHIGAQEHRRPVPCATTPTTPVPATPVVTW